MSDLLIGRNPVLEALNAQRPIHALQVLEGPGTGSLKTLIQQAKELGIPIKSTPKRKLDQMAKGKNHQGVIAIVAAKPYVDWQDVLDMAWQRGETPLFVALDQIEDPHNLGSILRSCDVTGAHCVILPIRRSVGLTMTVAKASAGAVEYVPVSRVQSLSKALDQLKNQGFQIIGTDASGSQRYDQVDWTIPTVLVIGSEGKGMRPSIQGTCTSTIHLPMTGNVNSLNAGVAAGILLYHAYTTRN